jgi:hypothetical protein
MPRSKIRRLDHYTIEFTVGYSHLKLTGEPTDFITPINGKISYNDPDDDDKIVVGLLKAYDVDLGNGLCVGGWNYFYILDSLDSDLALCCALFDDSNELTLEAAQAAGDFFGSNLLVLDRLLIPEKKYRGFGLGYAAMQELVRLFGRGALVALTPVPLQYNNDRNMELYQLPAFEDLLVVKGGRAAARRKLVNYYNALGFEMVKGTDVMVFSTANVMPTVAQALKRLKKLKAEMRSR